MRRRDFLKAAGLAAAAATTPLAAKAIAPEPKPEPKPEPTVAIWSFDDISMAVGEWPIPATTIEGLEPYTATKVADAQLAAIVGDDGLRETTFADKDGLWILSGTFGHHGRAVICLCPTDPERAKREAHRHCL